MSDRILDAARHAKEQSDSVHHDLRIIKNELLPLIDTETEQDLEPDEEPAIMDYSEDLDVTSSKALKMLSTGRYIFRSLAGLCRESNNDEATMLQTLSVLVSRSLAGKVSGKNGVRWHITEKGRRVLESQM